MRAILIKPDNTTISLDFKAGQALDILQASVGGYIELIRSSNQFDIYANEEGKLRNLPFNPIASALAGQPVVGSVVVTGLNCRSLPQKQSDNILKNYAKTS